LKFSEIDKLDVIAGRVDKTLEAISRASTTADKMRTSALYGSLGFCIGVGVSFTILAAASMLVYAPLIVPLTGLSGLLAGILGSRDKIDRANERSIELVEAARAQRIKDINYLERHIALARHEQSSSLQILEKNLTDLIALPPIQLQAYYNLKNAIDRPQNDPASTRESTEQQMLEARKPSSTGLLDIRNTKNTS